MSSFPAYRRRVIRGRAVGYVTLTDSQTGRRRDVWLGDHASPEARQLYARTIAEWEGHGRRLVAASPAAALTVGALADRYWREAVEGQYGRGERSSIDLALRVLRQLYGTTPAAQFGPNALRQVRQAMITGDPGAIPPRRPWTRRSINKQVHRLRAMFRWAGSHELLPESVYAALSLVEPLRQGRTSAGESPAVPPAPDAAVEAVRPLVSRQVRAMIDLQLLTGMRPGEVCGMRATEIDRRGKVWLYQPARHKTAHHGKGRTIYLGPRAQAIVAEFLGTDMPPGAPLFSPAQAERERRQRARERRTSPEGVNRARDAQRANAPRCRAGSAYSVDSYRRAVAVACARACVPHWHPHQLRHNYATAIRRRYGIEAAQVLLGHGSAVVTEVYAERDVARALQVVQEVG